MHRKKKFLWELSPTNKVTPPIEVAPYFTVPFCIYFNNIKDRFVAIIFFFHYLTLGCPRDCVSKLLKNKCPLGIWNTTNFNKSSYGTGRENLLPKNHNCFSQKWVVFGFGSKISLITR